MRAFLDHRQSLHDPQTFLRMGKPSPSPEAPARIDALRTGATAAGCTIEEPQDHGLAPVARIHTPEYLHFLQTIHRRWSALDGTSAEVIPNTHPQNRDGAYPDHPVGQAGVHQGDTACPVGPDTWESAYWSAQSALSAAAALETDGAAYALCRPPGHHAGTDQAKGFCFLSNSAIAAQALADKGRRVAILDVDVHHGDGTQQVFYDRPDILTVSIHADPSQFYPFFTGHAHERGRGAGLGANLNLPLAMGSGDAAYLAGIERGLEQIAAFAADSLVVALGLDAHESDPFRALTVTTDGFARMAQQLRAAGLPTLLIQEGGYLSPQLSENLTATLSAWTRNL